MAHLLVTGGAGYIGSHAVRALARAGHSAVVLDDLRSGKPCLEPGVPLARHDVGARGDVARTLERHGPFDAVLHFAASISVADSVADPLGTYANNVSASLVLISEAVRHGLRAFVLSSTAAVYGHPKRQPIPETASVAPLSPYGASKALVERILADVERAHGLRFAALRYFNAAGADPEGGIGECHVPETHLIPSALEAAAGLREELLLFGTDHPTPDGTCIRDYVHVTDLAAAHVLALEALLEGRAGGIYNLGTGRGHSNREVLAAVERVTGRRVPVRDAPPRPGDPPHLVADPTRFVTEYGWKPRLSDLDSVVSSAWSWLQNVNGV